MKKSFLIFVFLLVFGASILGAKFVFSAAHTCSDPPLTTFSDGSTSKTVTLSSGGGTVEAAKIKLSLGTEICSAEMKIDKTTAGGGGTPYIWAPLSGTNRLVQIKTSDGSVVRTFSNNADNCAGSAFSNPSRITVFPGSAVWVANRGGGSVTRLGLKTNCSGDDCYECKGTYSDVGDGPRGVTFDANGDVWTGAYENDKICKYKADGTLIECKNSGCRTYGMIGDSSGNVWIADSANGKVCKCSGAISCSSGFSDSVYGIGMDNDGDIWVANPGAAEVNEIKGADYGIDAGKVLQTCAMPHNNTGIAVDGNNNVWSNGHWDNQAYVIKGEDCSKVFTKSSVCSRGMPHGVAIDSNNNAWVVCRTGEVVQLEFTGSSINEIRRIDLNACCGSGTGDSASYNYSDMTGFRTPKITINIASKSIIATSYPFVINDANVPGFSSALSGVFQTCGCQGCASLGADVCGNLVCEVPITISSVFAGGSYILNDLEITYNEPSSKVGGGLVPCGRRCDDPTTPLDETKPCQLCHLFVLSDRIIDFLFLYVLFPLAVLMIVLAGILYIGSVFEILPGGFQTLNQAKGIIFSVVIGIVVIFASFILLGLFFKLIGLADWTTNFYQNWWSQGFFQINCQVK